MRHLDYNKMNVAVQFTLALYYVLSMYVNGYRAKKLRAFTSPHELEKWNLLVWIHEVKNAMLYKVECECVKQNRR